MKLPLEEHEVVLLTFRKHWIILLLELLPLAILFVLPFALYYLFQVTGIPFGPTETVRLEIPSTHLFFAGAAWSLIIWMRVATTVTHYYLDAWVITSDHLIDIEQKNFFHRQTTILRLDRIQDTTVETPGILPTLLHFGNIHVQTAGKEREFVMRGIANPKYVREVILHQQDLLYHNNAPVPDPQITREFQA